MTTNNTHKRKTTMHSAGFEPVIPARERQHIHAFDRVGAGIMPQKSYKY